MEPALYHAGAPDHRRRGPVGRGAAGGRVRRADPRGPAEGLEVLLRIVPSLIALLTAVYMLRASGALELAAQALTPLLDRLGIPPEPLALMLVRPMSGSAALGVGAELIHLRPGLLSGPDGGGDAGLHRDHLLHHRRLLRRGGRLPTRYAIPAALCADLAGFLAAAWAVRLCFGVG